MTTIIVRFNSPSEFMEELRKGGLCEPVLRLTQQFTPSHLSPNIQAIAVLATALRKVGDDVLEVIQLTRYCGDDWGEHFQQSNAAKQRAETQMKWLEKAATEIKLEVRAGVYEVPASDKKG